MIERKRKINLFLHSIEYLLAFGIFFLFGIIRTLALETKTLYSSNSSGSLSGNNNYIYGYINQGGVQTTTSASVGATVNDRALALIFYLYEPVIIGKTYTLVVNFKGSDLINTFSSNMVQVATCNGEVCNDNAIVSVVKNNPNGWSNKLTITFNPVTSGSILFINLSDKTTTRYITGTFDNQTFGISSVTLDSVNQNEDIMNNANQNANNIINNNNSNTQEIIENQNQNTQDIIDSNKVCSYIDKNSIYTDNSLLGSSGTVSSNSSFGITNYINITNADLTLIVTLNSSTEMCFYNVNKDIISCTPQRNFSLNQVITIPNNAVYARFTIAKTNNKPQYKICQNGNQANSNAINDLNDSINDDDIGGATQDGADFILDFDTNTFGLTSIVTAPLNLIQSLTSSTCSELELPLPFLKNKKLKLPCMTVIYQNTFGSLFTMYQTITFGIIAYWVCVRIFNQVKDFKNPEHDEIEVVDL